MNDKNLKISKDQREYIDTLLKMYHEKRCNKTFLIKQIGRSFDKEKADEIVKNILTQK